MTLKFSHGLMGTELCDEGRGRGRRISPVLHGTNSVSVPQLLLHSSKRHRATSLLSSKDQSTPFQPLCSFVNHHILFLNIPVLIIWLYSVHIVKNRHPSAHVPISDIIDPPWPVKASSPRKTLPQLPVRFWHL